MTRLPSILLALVLVGATGTVRAGEAAAAKEPTVSLEVDLSALPPGEYTTEYIATQLPEHQARVLADGGITVTDGADDTIRIAVSRYGEGEIHYRFTVALYEDGSETPTAERTLTCELCRESDLFTKIGEEVARMSGRLLYATSEEPEPKGPQAEPVEPEQTDPAPHVRRIGGAGWAGIAAAVVGAAVGVGGVVELRRPPERIVDPQNDRRLELTQALSRATVFAVLTAVCSNLAFCRRRHQSLSSVSSGTSFQSASSL